MNEGLHIIAEAGTNHGAKLETAKKLVDVAKEAGADSVKFQIIYPDGLYLPKIFKDGAYEKNEVFEIRRAGMLPDADYSELAGYSAKVGVPFTASIFDKRGLDLLETFNPPYVKIASCDLNNTGLLKMVAERGHKLVISSGMSTFGDVERAIEDITQTGHRDIVVLHCVSVYPCPTGRMNLGFIKKLQTLGFPVGLSDHTENNVAAIAAIGMGATWIEKHYTLDRNAEGFDHAYAMEPEMLKNFIADVRMAYEACKPQIPKVGIDEADVRQRARRGVFAARDLSVGEVLKEQDLLVVRPEAKLEPTEVELVVGGKITRALRACEAVSKDDVE